MSIVGREQESRPFIKFSALSKQINKRGDFEESTRVVLLPLDTSFATLDHIQRYASKPGWIYHSHGNLQPENENHAAILNFINTVQRVASAMSASDDGIKAKLEKRQKENKTDGQ